jgi:hypothetical protein
MTQRYRICQSSTTVLLLTNCKARNISVPRVLYNPTLGDKYAHFAWVLPAPSLVKRT